MENHIKEYHWQKKNSRPAPAKDTEFLQPMYCICGFKSTRGNELGRLLFNSWLVIGFKVGFPWFHLFI
jgi:hypothetical protein